MKDAYAAHMAELRRRAEMLADVERTRKEENIESLPPHELRGIIHELRVHQIELELQNEELRRAQVELDSARARYFDFYHLAPIGYLTLNEQGFITESNLSAAALLNVPRTALAQQQFTDFIYPADQDRYYLLRMALFETAQPQMCELRMVKSDAIPVWVLLDAQLVEDDAGTQTSRIVLIDISVRKQADEDHQKLQDLKLDAQIQQTQRLESLSVLASGVAHDFNNLMSGIYGYIDIALDKTNNETATQVLRKAIATIDRARGLTTQLLTLAKGGAPLQKATPLLPFLHETVQFALSGSNVSCTIKAAEDLWQCDIDSSQISQVIDNLIINAQQAMPDGGTIDVRAVNVTLDGSEPSSLAKGRYVRLSIKDDGIGILRDSLPHIFDPFYTTKIKGHGLGLATCFSIVNRHGGAIDVESEPGRGSTFHVYLPASVEGANANAVETTTHQGNGTMIVMDDEEMVRETVTHMLESLGYDVISRNDGREAVSVLNEEMKALHPVAGVFLDLTVPGGTGGKTAVLEIRKLMPDVPVFAASGYSDDPIMVNPAAFGFTASIAKPFNKSDLTDLLERYVRKSVI